MAGDRETYLPTHALVGFKRKGNSVVGVVIDLFDGQTYSKATRGYGCFIGTLETKEISVEEVLSIAKEGKMHGIKLNAESTEKQMAFIQRNILIGPDAFRVVAYLGELIDIPYVVFTDNMCNLYVMGTPMFIQLMSEVEAVNAKLTKAEGHKMLRIDKQSTLSDYVGRTTSELKYFPNIVKLCENILKLEGDTLLDFDIDYTKVVVGNLYYDYSDYYKWIMAMLTICRLVSLNADIQYQRTCAFIDNNYTLTFDKKEAAKQQHHEDAYRSLTRLLLQNVLLYNDGFNGQNVATYKHQLAFILNSFNRKYFNSYVSNESSGYNRNIKAFITLNDRKYMVKYVDMVYLADKGIIDYDIDTGRFIFNMNLSGGFSPFGVLPDLNVRVSVALNSLDEKDDIEILSYTETKQDAYNLKEFSFKDYRDMLSLAEVNTPIDTWSGCRPVKVVKSEDSQILKEVRSYTNGKVSDTTMEKLLRLNGMKFKKGTDEIKEEFTPYGMAEESIVVNENEFIDIYRSFEAMHTKTKRSLRKAVYYYCGKPMSEFYFVDTVMCEELTQKLDLLKQEQLQIQSENAEYYVENDAATDIEFYNRYDNSTDFLSRVYEPGLFMETSKKAGIHLGIFLPLQMPVLYVIAPSKLGYADYYADANEEYLNGSAVILCASKDIQLLKRLQDDFKWANDNLLVRTSLLNTPSYMLYEDRLSATLFTVVNRVLRRQVNFRDMIPDFDIKVGNKKLLF